MTNGEIISAWVNGVMVVGTAFALGWFMRGDIIYGGMFRQQTEIVKNILPIKGNEDGKN